MGKEQVQSMGGREGATGRVEDEPAQHKPPSANFNLSLKTTSLDSSSTLAPQLHFSPATQPETGNLGFSLSVRPKIDFSNSSFDSSVAGDPGMFEFSFKDSDSDRGDKGTMDGANTTRGKQQQPKKSLFGRASMVTFGSKPTPDPASSSSSSLFGAPSSAAPSSSLFSAPLTTPDQANVSGESSGSPFTFASTNPFRGRLADNNQKRGIPTTDRLRLESIEKSRSAIFGATPTKSVVFADIQEIPRPRVTFSPSTTSLAGQHPALKATEAASDKMPAFNIPASFTFGDPKRAVDQLSFAQVKKQMAEYESESESSVEGQDAEQPVNSTSVTSSDSDDEREAEKATLQQHLSLLQQRPDIDELNEIKSAPLFTEPVRKYASSLAKLSVAKPFTQYGLLGGDISQSSSKTAGESNGDPRIFWNIAAPSSFFICGSQGSGKSHNLSCLLENALAPCEANTLPRPLTGLLFHYDTFFSDTGGSPCEAAWLSTNPNIKVRVLCPPTNIGTMKKMYARFPNIRVQELRLNEDNLDTKRMLNLMCVSANGTMPLYMSVVNRILRELRVTQQKNGLGFDYTEFKRRLSEEALTEAQMAPLKQRLDTLESFMVEGQAKAFELFAGRTGGFGYSQPPQPKYSTPKKKSSNSTGIDWSPKHGTLTIVDLSCPCVTGEMACSLFNICLSLFLEQDSQSVGRVVALDEAHKYMNDSPECQMLTQALLETIRLQRHLGARILISTQEPTISPKLLDLCSVTVVHRFTSPAWLNALHKHIAGVSKGAEMFERATKLAAQTTATEKDQEEIIDGVGTLNIRDAAGGDPLMEMFSQIVSLKVGEALIFAPSAVIGVKKTATNTEDGGLPESVGVQRLTHGVLKVRIRNRTTGDGGRSIMAA